MLENYSSQKKSYNLNVYRAILVYPLGVCHAKWQSVASKACSHEPVGFSPYQQAQKNAHKGQFWCTRWGFATQSGKVSQSKLARTNPLGSHHTNRHKKTPTRGVWCTRWGSNPNSTASEAVMLSNYTTSTFFKNHLYFTIFYFLFASVYGIIFANKQKIFLTRACYVENGCYRYEWWRR